MSLGMILKSVFYIPVCHVFLYPRFDIGSDCFFIHPKQGQSIIKVRIDQVEGQSLDLQIFERACMNVFETNEVYFKKKLIPLKDFYVALDNNNREGCFELKFHVVSEKGHFKKNHEIRAEIISDKDEMDKIINSIMDAGMDKR